MAESKGGSRWGFALLGLVAVCAIGWLLLAKPNAEPDMAVVPSATAITPSADPPAPAVQSAPPAFRVSAQGRLKLDTADIPNDRPLVLALDIADEARAGGTAPALIVSTDGRKIDTMVSALPGAGTGVRLEIEPGFLQAGRYMIQVETVDNHPLQIRRYVLEIE